ncbi:MAG TPA: hypothetical protein VL017_03020, partial [Devosia sp.]|nr:hypothetical protein [Devosia sp.]
MSVIPGSGLISLINGFVDRAIGADGLTPRVRDKLLRQQLGSVARMAPAMLAASVVVSAVLLTLTWQTAQFWPVLAAAGAIILIGVHGSYLAAVTVRVPNRAPGAPHASVIRTIIYTTLLGCLWGFVLNVLPIDQNPTLHAAATISVGGLFCVALMALVHYPQA